VHPRAEEIAGEPAYRTIGAVPGAVELAVVAVPAVGSRARWSARPGRGPRPSSCSGCCPEGTELIVGGRGRTPTSGLSSPAGPAAGLSSCSATWPSGSRRSAHAPPTTCCARCVRSRCSTATAAPRPRIPPGSRTSGCASALAAASPEIAELGCNPLIAGPPRRVRRPTPAFAWRWSGRRAHSRPWTDEPTVPHPARGRRCEHPFRADRDRGPLYAALRWPAAARQSSRRPSQAAGSTPPVSAAAESSACRACR
jgi:hypothetical protein